VIKEVFAPHLNRNVKLGRNLPIANSPHLKLERYIKMSLPTPPASTNWRAKSMPSFRRIYLNDQLGDCVIAAFAHIIGQMTGNATGTDVQFTDTQIQMIYSAISGYVPGNPSTDNGCDMQTAMNWIVTHGFPGVSRPLGWLSVDLTNSLLVRQAIYLFEHVDIGVALPDAAIDPFPSGDGFTWDVAGDPVPENGHSVPLVDYDASGNAQIVTWALVGNVTSRWLAKYGARGAGGEGYVLLDEDMISRASQKAPSGVAWSDLIADFDALGGHVPVPAPPVPVPVPPNPVSGGVSLAQAEAAVKTAFAHQPWLMSAGSATKIALKALESLTAWPK
jgi:hypothetical protein